MPALTLLLMIFHPLNLRRPGRSNERPAAVFPAFSPTPKGDLGCRNVRPHRPHRKGTARRTAGTKPRRDGGGSWAGRRNAAPCLSMQINLRLGK
ncbi:hypothetical protein GQ54DRAFT_25467 [Martensiomyces pterosporus]|nr:hypothetical protein GQ54DRAFT_25467 [Martensiomyces pterosporus]